MLGATVSGGMLEIGRRSAQGRKRIAGHAARHARRGEKNAPPHLPR
ncbi:hypothetical protein [Olsenella sp. SW781]|nr:hypothetical protein [Olsenella sp. SW781]